MSARKLYEAGYTDLVSVIPPRADLAPTSKVTAESRGKAPGRRRLDGRWTGYPWLTEPAPTLRDIQQWERWGANVGLHGRRFPGLDIDSEDDQLTRFVVQEAQRVLGSAPVRTSRPPRRLLVYRTDAPFPRQRAIIIYRGQKHTLEVLGEGRQYLVHGRHPSGSDYGWEGTPLWEWRPDDLTAIDAEKVAAFYDYLRKRLKGRAELRVSALKDNTAAPPQEELLAPSMDALRDVVPQIPNDYTDRDTYIQVGYAIRAAAGPDNEGEAFDLWADWAARWEGGDNDPATLAADWSGMTPPFRVGWGFLQRMASERGAGSVVAAHDFDADPDAQAPAMEDLVGSPALSEVWVVETVASRVSNRIRYLPETDHFHIWGM